MSTENMNIIELDHFDVWGDEIEYGKAGLFMSLSLPGEPFGSDEHYMKFTVSFEYPRTAVTDDDLHEIQWAGKFLQGFDPDAYEWGVDTDRDADIERAQEFLEKFDLEVEDVPECITVDDYDSTAAPSLFKILTDTVEIFSKFLSSPVRIRYPWGEGFIDDVIIEPSQYIPTELENIGSLDELLESDSAEKILHRLTWWRDVDISYS